MTCKDQGISFTKTIPVSTVATKPLQFVINLIEGKTSQVTISGTYGVQKMNVSVTVLVWESTFTKSMHLYIPQ